MYLILLSPMVWPESVRMADWPKLLNVQTEQRMCQGEGGPHSCSGIVAYIFKEAFFFALPLCTVYYTRLQWKILKTMFEFEIKEKVELFKIETIDFSMHAVLSKYQPGSTVTLSYKIYLIN